MDATISKPSGSWGRIFRKHDVDIDLSRLKEKDAELNKRIDKLEEFFANGWSLCLTRDGEVCDGPDDNSNT